MEIAFVGLMLILGMVCWGMNRHWTRESEPVQTVVIKDRKTRFREYVRGEEQLMVEWEEAFDPQAMSRAKEIRQHYRKYHSDTDRLQFGGVTKMPSKLGAQVWWEQMHDPAAVRVPGGTYAGPHSAPNATMIEAQYKPRKYGNRETCRQVVAHQFLVSKNSYNPDDLRQTLMQCER